MGLPYSEGVTMKRLFLVLAFVLFGSVAFAQNQRFNTMTLIPQTQPANPREGMAYQNSVDHIYYIYNGTVWVPAGGTTGAVVGPGSAVNNNLPSFNGTTGALIKDSGIGSAAVTTLTGSQTLTNKTLTSPVVNTPTGIVKADVGLANVDNTSDATKNGATAILTNKTLTAPVINSPTGLVKADVGLSNVDNTSDAAKNAATATLTNKTLTTPVINSPTGLVKGDVGLSNVDNTSDATKNAASVTLTNKTLTTPVINSPTGLVKGDVGLGNVDNTSDATKNAASVTLTNKTLTGPVINTPTGIVKSDVGLGNVDNTSDATKDAAVATLTNKTLTTPTIGSFTNATHNHSNAAGGGTISGADLTLTDVTTNDATASAHGFLPKLSGNAYDWFNGSGTFSRTMARGTITTSSPWTFSQTWNAAAVAFTGITVDITDTASLPTTGPGAASSSTGFAITTGSGNVFRVFKDPETGGTNSYKWAIGVNQNATAIAASQDFVIKTGTGGQVGFMNNAQNIAKNFSVRNILLAGAGVEAGGVYPTIIGGDQYVGYQTASGRLVAWASSATSADAGVIDTAIGRNAAGVLEVNNGVLGTFRDLRSRHLLGAGTAPGVTNTSANSCGTTTATLVGSDTAGKVTVGATAGTSCTITFTTAFTNAPACFANNETTANLSRATSTTTTVILAGTFVAGDVLSYGCLSY